MQSKETADYQLVLRFFSCLILSILCIAKRPKDGYRTVIAKRFRRMEKEIRPRKKVLTLYMSRIEPCNENDYQTLVEIWERSVRATHSFLTEKDIMDIRESLISKYFRAVSLYVVYDEETIAGFMGLYDHNIEMLFVDSKSIGKGLGSKLLDFAKSLGADSVDVNEQNPRALGFYQTHGFRVVNRDEHDSDGRPFPILHLKL